MSRPESPTATVDTDPAAQAEGGATEAGPGVSRRALIANAVLAGTAVMAAPAVGRAVQDTTTEDPPYTGQLDQPLVARVRDPRTGVIDIFFGEEHIVLHDRAIAARLARAVT
jgi:hypothetical protein